MSTGVDDAQDMFTALKSRPTIDEFDCLCKYLGVSTHMSRLLENQGELMDCLVNRWAVLLKLI